ncbi:DUF4358 domain-containing protein [Peptostreptococcus faecalis]|uniref:DUF4358 domain-containing protein n=1 Tax=Peptostreptococcus faecalis TaxID=2045015 RepID=UPI001FA918BC|nr:DUF4358 domain-containing protein [Peptostreptococcus faecalis]
MHKDDEKNTPSTEMKNNKSTDEKKINNENNLNKDDGVEEKVNLEITQTFSVPESETNKQLEQTARLRIIKSEEFESKKKGTIIKEKFRIKPMKTSSKYRRKYIGLVICVLVAVILAYQFVKVKEVDFSKLSNNIQKKVDMDEFLKGDDMTLRKLYGIESTEVEGYVSFAPKSNMSAEEILVIKCKPNRSEDVLKKVQNRVDAQSNSFKNYAPEQYSIVSGSELEKKGDYVYFISSKNINSINQIIDESYK